MMRMRKFQNLVMVGLLGLCLATCAPDPRNQADADATRLLAEQDAADQQQAREQAARVFSVELAEREQVSAQWVRSRQEFIRWSMLAATMALSLALLGGGYGLSLFFIGRSRTAVTAAALRAQLIALDAATGQYPLINYEGHGMVSLTDPNTGMTLKLDTRNDADRQMIATSGAVRLSGIVSHNAAIHKTDPAGVALVGTNPITIFDGEGERPNPTEDNDYDN
jgi:hypothetical protein